MFRTIWWFQLQKNNSLIQQQVCFWTEDSCLNQLVLVEVGSREVSVLSASDGRHLSRQRRLFFSFLQDCNTSGVSELSIVQCNWNKGHSPALKGCSFPLFVWPCHRSSPWRCACKSEIAAYFCTNKKIQNVEPCMCKMFASNFLLLHPVLEFLTLAALVLHIEAVLSLGGDFTHNLFLHKYLVFALPYTISWYKLKIRQQLHYNSIFHLMYSW